MARARAVVSLGLSARTEAKLQGAPAAARARWCCCPTARAFSDAVAAEIADALNVKQLEAVTDLEGLLDYAAAPELPRPRPEGRQAGAAVKDALAAVDGAAVAARARRDGGYDLALGRRLDRAARPRRRRGPRRRRTRSSRSRRRARYAVALDTTLDDELRAEGIARELVRLLNDQRKATGFEIADRIRVRLGATGRVEAAAHQHRDWIAREVLAVELVVEPGVTDGVTRVDVDGEPVSVDLERVER